jgi:hypothetical protein
MTVSVPLIAPLVAGALNMIRLALLLAQVPGAAKLQFHSTLTEPCSRKGPWARAIHARRKEAPMSYNCKTPEDILRTIKDDKIEMIDLRFTDLPGLWQHFSVPPSPCLTSWSVTRSVSD